ncbi:MAG: nitrous oxide-stimulated promoter family protein [Bacteroidales bacterium]
MDSRLEREKRIVSKMIKIYCIDNHQSDGSELCSECEDLKNYAFKKLLRCPFAKNKPVCSKCKIHCYNTQKREHVKKIMRYSGPKMIYKHPIDTMIYFYNKLIHINYTPA